MDQNGEESVLMRDNYRSSGHLSGGKRKFLGALLRWSFTLRPTSILLQLHQGQLARGRGYRRKRRRGSQRGGAFHEETKHFSSDRNEGKCEFGSSLGLDDGDKVSLCPHVEDLHRWWLTDG